MRPLATQQAANGDKAGQASSTTQQAVGGNAASQANSATQQASGENAAAQANAAGATQQATNGDKAGQASSAGTAGPVNLGSWYRQKASVGSRCLVKISIFVENSVRPPPQCL